MCIVSTVSSLRVVGNVSVCGVNKVDLREKKNLRTNLNSNLRRRIITRLILVIKISDN